MHQLRLSIKSHKHVLHICYARRPTQCKNAPHTPAPAAAGAPAAPATSPCHPLLHFAPAAAADCAHHPAAAVASSPAGGCPSQGPHSWQTLDWNAGPPGGMPFAAQSAARRQHRGGAARRGRV
eukprot:1157398-Pelagomonas_calceolata.AAC.5